MAPGVGRDLVHEDVVVGVPLTVWPGAPELDGGVRDAGLVVLGSAASAGSNSFRVVAWKTMPVIPPCSPSYSGVGLVIQGVFPLAPVDPALMAFRGQLVEQQAAAEPVRQRRDARGVEFVVHRHPGAGEAPKADLADEELGERAQKLRILVEAAFSGLGVAAGERRGLDAAVAPAEVEVDAVDPPRTVSRRPDPLFRSGSSRGVESLSSNT